MVFGPHTPRHFDSHLGRWSIYHSPDTMKFTWLHAPGSPACVRWCTHAHKCGCVSMCHVRTHSCLLSCQQAVSVWAHPCAHMHKCSLEGSSCVPLCLYVSVSVHGGVNRHMCRLSWAGGSVCTCSKCVCVHACTRWGGGCLPMGMSMRILVNLLMR